MQNWQSLQQNPQLWSQFLVKQAVIRAIRSFFEAKGYNELESPILSPALPSEQYMDFLKVDVGGTENYLIPSTERYNKLALAAGIGNHFVITKVFRDSEKVGPNHSPEFTMLEWYHLDGTYQELMQDTQELVQSILKKLGHDDLHSKYQGQQLDFGGQWPRASVAELLKQHAQLELSQIMDVAQIRRAALDRKFVNNSQLAESMNWQDLFELIFFNAIEPNLPADKPFFVYDYPSILCPLALPNADGLTSQKVELYIANKEVANGYSELGDAELLEKNLRQQYELRKQQGKPLAKFDDQLINALHSGLPPVAGIGMGLDRLVMILADAQNVSDINLFPFGQ